jgi:hypothetical protein
MFISFFIKDGKTSINGTVVSENNLSIRPLENINLVLIIKDDKNHDDIHQMKININQNTFPIKFHISNIKEITKNGSHLMTILIFGHTHRLLWEGILSRHYLVWNHMNLINFTVRDVCKSYCNII